MFGAEIHSWPVEGLARSLGSVYRPLHVVIPEAGASSPARGAGAASEAPRVLSVTGAPRRSDPRRVLAELCTLGRLLSLSEHGKITPTELEGGGKTSLGNHCDPPANIGRVWRRKQL